MCGESRIPSNSPPLPAAATSHADPGQVVRLTAAETEVGVGTGEGVLGLITIQLEGRRPQSARDFLLGYPDFLGAQL